MCVVEWLYLQEKLGDMRHLTPHLTVTREMTNGEEALTVARWTGGHIAGT